MISHPLGARIYCVLTWHGTNHDYQLHSYLTDRGGGKVVIQVIISQVEGIVKTIHHISTVSTTTIQGDETTPTYPYGLLKAME